MKPLRKNNHDEKQVRSKSPAPIVHSRTMLPSTPHLARKGKFAVRRVTGGKAIVRALGAVDRRIAPQEQNRCSLFTSFLSLLRPRQSSKVMIPEVARRRKPGDQRTLLPRETHLRSDLQLIRRISTVLRIKDLNGGKLARHERFAR